MSKRIHVVINPASGQPDAILNKLNSVFRATGVEWDISITHKSGDATRYADQAVADGVDVVAAYGGDGTVMEVANALKDGETPMAILPGGTANLMSVELGIPKDLIKAAEIAASPDSVVRRIDMGQAGERTFMLRVGVGFAAEKVVLADRELKDRWGILAYSIAGLKALTTVKQANYRVTVDGKTYELDGKTCVIDNAGNLGMSGLTAAKDISVSDGLLDVFVVRDASIGSLFAVGASIAGLHPDTEAAKHWQGREILIETDAPLTVQGDGEIWDDTPLHTTVLPGVLPVLTL